jgi:hypothetical protein
MYVIVLRDTCNAVFHLVVRISRPFACFLSLSLLHFQLDSARPSRQTEPPSRHARLTVYVLLLNEVRVFSSLRFRFSRVLTPFALRTRRP